MQERFASILASCTNEKGVVDKTKLLELLRLSPDDPVTLIFDVLITNLGISEAINKSGERIRIHSEKLMGIQSENSEVLISALKDVPKKLDRLLEENSKKIFLALDEIRILSQDLKEDSNKRMIEIQRFNSRNALFYFILGGVLTLACLYIFIYGRF